MKIPLKTKFNMILRRSPVGRIQKVSDLLDEYKCEHEIENIEAHYLAGGNIELLAKAICELSKNQVQYERINLCAFDLSGKDLMVIVEEMIRNKGNPNFDLMKYVYSEKTTAFTLSLAPPAQSDA